MENEMKTISPTLLGDVRHIINEGKAQVAMAVNVALTNMYWHIGQRINDELHNERAEYGSQIVASLARQLQEEFGEQNFSVNLMHLKENNIRVAEYLTKLPDKQVFEQKLQLAIARAKEASKSV